MADDFLSTVPTLSQVLGAAPPPSAAPAPGGAPPPDTGTGFFGSALGAGLHDLGASTAGFAQAVSQATGLDRLLPGFTDAQAQAVARERAAAAADANPAYSGGGMDPASLAYGFLRGLPSFAPMIAGAAALPELAGARAAGEGAGFLARMLAPRGLAGIAGGALGAYPGSVGENIERATDEGQPVDQGAAQKALALGVPEALLQGAFPGAVEETLAGGVAKSLAEKGLAGRVATGAGVMGLYQAGTGAATEALMQQMGDPNRTFAQRSQQILDAALSGGVQGAVFGGLTHMIAKVPVERITDDNLRNVTSGPLGLPPPPDVPQLPPPQRVPPGPPDLPGQRPPSGATIRMPQGTLDGDIIDDTPKQLPPPGPSMPGDQPISGQPIIVPPTDPTQVARPALPAPPIVLPDDSLDTMKSKMQGLSNQDLINHANMHPGEQSAQAAMDLLKDRLKDSGATSPAEVKSVLQEQDNTATIKKITKGFIPDFLKEHLGDTQNLKNAIFDEANQRDKDGKPFGTRLTDIAREFGILKDDGSLVNPRPEAPPQDVKGPVDVNADKPIEGTTNIGPEPTDDQGNQVPTKPEPPASPTKDAVPEQHQAKWQALDDIEKSLPDNLPPELADTAQKIADAKSKLANPKRGEVGQVVSFTNRLRDKLKALDTIREGQPTADSPPVPQPPEDPTKGATRFDTPPEDTTVTPQPPPAPEPAPAAPTSAKEINIQAGIKANAGRAAKFGASPEAQRAASEFLIDRTGRKPIQPGEEIPQPKRPLNDRPSNEDVTTKDTEPNASPAGDVDGLISSRPTTQLERDLSFLIDSGATPRQLLQHVVRNGSSSIRRVWAARLLQMSKAAPTIRFGSQAEAAIDHPTAARVYGDYRDSDGRIRVFDTADMEHTLIHEFTHAATIRALRSGGELADKASKLFKFALSQLTDDERKQYGFKSPAEMIAEALSNPNFAHFLDGLKAPADLAIPKASVWRAVKELIRRTFGFPKGSETMLDHVTDISGRLMDETTRRWEAGSARDINDTTGLYARSVQDFGDQVLDYVNHHADPMSWPTRVFKMVAGWRDLGGLADAMRNVIPAMRDKVKVSFTRKILGDRMASLAVQAINMRRALPRETQKLLSDIKQFTNLGVDPRRNWAEHTWLHNDPNAAGLKAEVAKANTMYAELKRKGGDKAYDAEHQTNNAMQSAYLLSEMRNVLRRDHADKVTLADDPFGRFQFDHSLRSSPRAAADYFHQELDSVTNLARKYIASVRDAMGTETDPVKKQAMGDSLKQLQSIERTVASQMTAREQAPNFALRRQGNYFVSGDMLKNFTMAHVSAIQDALAKAGFHDIGFQHNAENNSFYMRVNSMSEATNLHRVMADLQKQGMLDKKPIASGAASKLMSNAAMLPEWVQRNIAELKNRMPDLPEGTDQDSINKYNAARDSAMNQMISQYLDMMPDSAGAKLFARRQGVQGFNTDMNRAFEERSMNAARGVANSATAIDMGNATASMTKQLRDVKTSSLDVHSMPERVRAQVAVNEALLREAQHGFNAGASPLDTVRHITHFFELGFSIPYAITLASQLPTLGLPELAKTHGFAASSAAMIRAMPMAMKIMQAAATGENKTGFMLTPDKLKAVGIPKDLADFIVKQDNRGDFNLSSYTSRIYDGLHHDGIMRTIHDVTGATTLYSEMAPRLVVALAAKDLFERRPSLMPKEGINDIHSFVSDKVQRSQFQWNADLNPRNTGKQGVLGQAGPLMTQFMGYHLKLMEKLYREAADSIGSRGEADKAGARKFLLGHVAAMTMLSGTMGLPMVSLFAGLYDKLADLVTGNNTHDIKSSYRNFLNTMFGKDVGEVLAHGVPRLSGIDLSRLGEDRIIPGTSLLSDKRRWSDAEGDFLKSLAGSAAGLGANIIQAGGDMINGDWLEAGQRAMPEMLRNIAEGAITASRGYRDKSGFSLPIKATTADAVKEMLGLIPEQKAEYQEEVQTKQGLDERAEFDKQNIMSHLAKAFNLHDPASYAAWLGSSQIYQQNHPGELPPAMQFNNYMQEHARSAALAGALGTPTGERMRDMLTLGATRFGNIQNQ